MKLSVLLITYNQEQYIEQALGSILLQNTSFEFDVIVADDCSTDKTLEIITRYAENTDIKFVFLKNTVNLGFIKNYQRAFEACDGEYIAILEGDDYWTDPKRLEKHADFLDNHRECSMSFNRIIYYYQEQADFKINEWILTNDDYEYITSKQMVVGNKIGNLSACVFRSDVIHNLNPEIYNLYFADWLLGMAVGQYGFLAQLKTPMSVYRVHTKGQWSQQDANGQVLEMLDNIAGYNKYLDYKYNDEFVRFESYLKRSLSNQKKRGWSDYIPPVLVYIVKLFIPPVLLKK